LPDACLGFYDHVLRLDREDQWWFEALWTPERDAQLRQRREELAARLLSPPSRSPVSLGTFRAAGGHRGAVAECRERIAAGEIFQANICMRLESSFDGDPAQLFCSLASEFAPAKAAFVAGPWGALASMSPELFLRREGRRVWTEPIKGTSRDRSELERSEKDRAENVMIVDLMRNDLGRVCEYGSVQVDALNELRPGPGVWHLVSTVSGELRDGVDDADLLRATFPPGSVTGAPKVQTLRVIHELESTGREVYTGAIGYASPVAGLELNVAIRTFEMARGRIWLGAGGGITWSSDPDRELDECIAKASPLITAVGGRIEEPSRVEVDLPRALHGQASRPDPAMGVFETVLVVDGEPQHLEDHLRRLGVEVEVLELHGTCRLRITLVDGHVSWETAPLPGEPPVDGFLLSPFLLPGGLGDRKWIDRRLVDSLGPGVPLLVDGDGSVLEAAWGNVWAIEGERLITPPADGRILPGVMRARVLELEPDAVEEPITLDRLRAADGVFLTSALRGAVPAYVEGGAGPHPRVTELADALLPSRLLT
jgi:para-aminobenzoate synthetase/4-amino-4-deoxychorismate lyase